MKMVLATGNEHKLLEVRRILQAADAGVKLRTVNLNTPETGASFAENALLKAQAASKATGLPALGDDSGLCVDALRGMPGVLSARWSGRHGDDEANLALLLGQLQDIPKKRRGAQFVCAAALVWPNGDSKVFEGEVVGTLTSSPRGEGGFGYDPIFVPEGFKKTLAEIGDDDKDAISHRGRAFRAFAKYLRVSSE